MAKKASKPKASKTKRPAPAKPGRAKSSSATARKSAARPPTGAKKTTRLASSSTRRSALPKRNSLPARAIAPRVAAPREPDATITPQSSGLSASDLAQFRRALLEKRAQLVGDVHTMSNEALNRNRQESSGNLSSMPIHMADLGTDNYEQEFTLGLIESERALLREIDEALHRIQKGTYGVCQATGKAIGKARLSAQPWTKYCYDYVLEQEKLNKRRF